MSNKKSVCDHLWIWGHSEDSFNEHFGRVPEPPMTPAEGMRKLGAKNIFFVPFSHFMDINAYSCDIAGLASVGLAVETWGEYGTNRLEKTLSLCPMFPQTDRVIYDDFFCEEALQVPQRHIKIWSEYTLEELIAERSMIHAAGYKMWLVLYQWQLQAKMDIQEYIDVFDGVSFWFWNEPTIKQYHEYSKLFRSMTVDKERLIGCYLYNFGLLQSADPKMVTYQLDRNLELLKQKEISGIVLHNNALGGFGLPAFSAAVDWVTEHGAENI